jgi:SAM-dependent methyltransferase
VTVKRSLLRLLDRLRLLRPVYRVYEELKALRPARRGTADDGLPMPPPWLIVRVTGSSDPKWFLESGRLAADAIRDVLATRQLQPEDFGSLLDFGCGCGRVIRAWRDLPSTAVHGTDTNKRAIDWCRSNLLYARFEQNGLGPPLPYADAQFDLVYSLSVLTHLPEDVQHAWMVDLARVLTPRGYLVLSTHGAAYRERLSEDELERFDRGELIVRWETVAGTNLCAAFHPDSYVRERLANGFDVLHFEPEGARGNPRQDLYLLRLK